jgi:hypothetical protein
VTTRKAVHPRISRFENHIIAYGTSCTRHLEGSKEKEKEIEDCASSTHLSQVVYGLQKASPSLFTLMDCSAPYRRQASPVQSRCTCGVIEKKRKVPDKSGWAFSHSSFERFWGRAFLFLLSFSSLVARAHRTAAAMQAAGRQACLVFYISMGEPTIVPTVTELFFFLIRSLRRIRKTK